MSTLSRSTSTERDPKSSQHHLLGDVGGARDERDACPGGSDARAELERGVRQIEIEQLAGLGIEDGEVLHASIPVPTRDPAVVQERERRLAEHPLRIAELGLGADAAPRVGPPSRRSRFHHPVRSLAKTRSPAGLQLGCQIDSSPSRPATRRSPAERPVGARSATSSSHPSHGIHGRFQLSQDSRRPSGAIRGVE